MGPEDFARIRQWTKHGAVQCEPICTDRPVFVWIVELDGGTAVGWVELFNVDLLNAKAEAGIGLYDERGKGLALFALRALERLAFNELGLHRIYTRIPAGRSDSIRLADRLWVHEGIERAAFRGADGWEDIYVYATVKEG